MNVLVLTQFFPPEPCAASNRNAALVEHLRSAGYGVEVVTGFPNFPSGVIPREYRRSLRTVEQLDRVRVTRLWTFASPRRSSTLRLLSWASLALSAGLELVLLRRPFDVLYVSSPPITLALPALLAVLRHRVRLVVDIRDAYPEVAIRMGTWKPSSPFATIVGWIAEWLYRRADLVVCVTDSIREEIVARGCEEEKILVAPNGFDRIVPSTIVPFERRACDFVATFVGNFGLAAGIDVIVDAAKLLRDDERIRIVLVGDGSELQRVRRRIRDERLSNVELLGARPRAEAMAALQAADLCIVPLKRHLLDSLPTKIFDALSVGCPVVVSAEGEARRFIERSRGGWYVPPEDPGALAAVIRRIAADPGERTNRAHDGNAYVEQNCDRARGMAAIITRLAALTADPCDPSVPIAEEASA